MLYIYIIFGIGLILFIRTGNQSTQNYYKFLDYLTEVESLKNPQVQINRLASPEISKQIPTTKVPKNVSRTIQTNQSDPKVLPKTCNSLLTLGSWKNFKIIENPQSLSEAEFNATSTLFHHNPKYHKIANLYKPKETYDFTYSGGVQTNEF